MLNDSTGLVKMLSANSVRLLDVPPVLEIRLVCYLCVLVRLKAAAHKVVTVARSVLPRAVNHYLSYAHVELSQLLQELSLAVAAVAQLY